ncbi:MAG: 2-octaprenyl-6-methoxyphenyl hydroxylase [Xanthomonadales bacterium]|nr:2-octaprenyl-6-methoxyphenyl hydroxylase [Xanthomonadales bacterium]
MQASQCDVLIVGGGLVGTSLAAALEDSGLCVVLAEAAGSAASPSPESFDERNLALARASLDALDRLGVMAHVRRAPQPLRHIHVSRVGDFGSVRIRAADHGVDALGGVILASDLGAALAARLADLRATRHCAGARVVDCVARDDAWRVTLERDDGAETIECRLLVGADGTRSGVRTALGVGVREHDYEQDLFVCAVESEHAPAGQAWERFSSAGPVALLPRNDGRFGAVCGVSRSDADAIGQLDDHGYLAFLQRRFGYRAGRFERVGRRVRYPIRAVIADRLAGVRGVLVGNAAQTIHPIGAQGFNLGLRDALGLADALRGAEDAGDAVRLQRYAAARAEDRRRTIELSDGLARLTAVEGPAAHLMRSLGLLGIGHLPGMRGPLVAGAMGYRGAPGEAGVNGATVR